MENKGIKVKALKNEISLDSVCAFYQMFFAVCGSDVLKIKVMADLFGMDSTETFETILILTLIQEGVVSDA